MSLFPRLGSLVPLILVVCAKRTPILKLPNYPFWIL